MSELWAAIGGGFFVWILTSASSYVVWQYWRPTIVARFTVTDDCIIRRRYTITRHAEDGTVANEDHEVTYVRIKVSNFGRTVVTGCRAWLVAVFRHETGEGGKDVYKQTAYSESLPLIWSYTPQVDAAHIPPRRDVARRRSPVPNGTGKPS